MDAYRDDLGRYKPGHPKLVLPAGCKVGRPKSLSGKVKDALAIAEDAMPRIIAAMLRTADGQDDSPAAVRQAAREYLCNRIYGKPNQPLSGSGQFVLLVKDWRDSDSDNEQAEGQT